MRKDAAALNTLFKQHGVEAEVKNIIDGSTVTRYEAKVNPFTVRMDSFTNLEENIAYLLRSRERPVVFPIYEKSVIAIDVPNGRTPDIKLEDVLGKTKNVSSLYTLPLLLGYTIENRPFFVDLVEIPHLLIAGTTGSGKSVGLKSMITALAHYRDDVEFIFIDPKCVELSVFKGLGEVYTEPDAILHKLQRTITRVEDRYNELAEAGVSKISELGEDGYDYVVLVIDELADIFSFHKKMRGALCQIVQKSRAAGVHVIAATQRPSVDVVSGLIKSNFPGRLAYRVSSYEDSRTILNSAGAEKLLGSGDLLYRKAQGSFERIQGPFVTNAEVKELLE